LGNYCANLGVVKLLMIKRQPAAEAVKNAFSRKWVEGNGKAASGRRLMTATLVVAYSVRVSGM
jgi:hypothetical protein